MLSMFQAGLVNPLACVFWLVSAQDLPKSVAVSLDRSEKVPSESGIVLRVDVAVGIRTVVVPLIGRRLQENQSERSVILTTHVPVTVGIAEGCVKDDSSCWLADGVRPHAVLTRGRNSRKTEPRQHRPHQLHQPSR